MGIGVQRDMVRRLGAVRLFITTLVIMIMMRKTHLSNVVEVIILNIMILFMMTKGK